MSKYRYRCQNCGHDGEAEVKRKFFHPNIGKNWALFEVTKCHKCGNGNADLYLSMTEVKDEIPKTL